MRSRVLVVDDEESLRDVLRQLLEPEGYEVETAGDGQQALELLRHATYDCVLVDLRMPVMDGLMFYQAVKHRNPKVAQRVIFCTGELLEGHLRWFLEGTGNRILLKPFRASHLLETCGEVCGHLSGTVWASHEGIGSLGAAQKPQDFSGIKGAHHGQGR